VSDELPGHNLIKAPGTLSSMRNDRRFCWTKLEEVVPLVQDDTKKRELLKNPTKI